MAKKITITIKEQIIVEKLLNTFVDSDHFSGEHVPKGIKDEQEANDVMIGLLKKLSK